jgi:hypothetical protein
MCFYSAVGLNLKQHFLRYSLPRLFSNEMDEIAVLGLAVYKIMGDLRSSHRGVSRHIS